MREEKSPPHGLTLGELVRALARFEPQVVGSDAVRLLDVRHDSRAVSSGDLFVARGRGAGFIHQAVEQGAAAVMIEQGQPLPDVGVPVLSVSDVRLALSFAAEAVWERPTQRIGVVGITGTNGKTTSSYLVQHAIQSAGGRAARLGTLGFAFEGQEDTASLTTPEGDEVSRRAAAVARAGGTHMVMEASSHALTLGRVEAVHFRVAAFTNLTQDHLDFHGTMDAYAQAKLRLFTELLPEASVVNVDDAFGQEILRRASGRVLAVGRGGHDVTPLGVSVDARGLHGRIRVLDREVTLESRLVGEHNLDNVLLSLGIVAALGLDVDAAAAGFAGAPEVPGRLERCDAPEDDVLVVVDYAHTPDALERALRAVRSLGSGQVMCVFGCGGDRDPDKRPKMGDAVGRLASRAVITNDNPRSEEPAVIARAIEAGLRPHGIDYEVELNRAAAIERAVLAAAPGDVILIAGKGHEPYQIIGATRRDFDDRVEAKRALALRRGAG
ncbi:MAG: UDP-N-acetylmuramoyl-L-alanyl-D-glutamate--2,6-diaminopimelate ligase [Myxococcales bacterium]|nr:UDP-N-acetylmuramoyl-L-alanyl-D-glutamate--2,6-diaminopimelate ligase [Myxococcales bacterium]MCB9577977.1 UDP-N-acetylmuramoyl-L-alanyl-D-glutamate--2,6-diaminopimelate ligase [Polyangiaceae bacterium]